MSARSGARPKLLVLNQYYDSVEATGQLLRQLCEDLSQQFDITVVAARTSGGQGTRSTDSEIRFLWAPSTRFRKCALGLRLLNYVTFLCGVLLSLVRARRPSVILCMTDPPVIGLMGVAYARLTRAPLLLVCQDVHPEVGLISGRLTNPALVAMLRVVQRALLSSADQVVAIGQAMRNRLIERGADPQGTTVIPNWVDLEVVGPESRRNSWAQQHGLAEQFVVMHSGNVGQLHALDTLLEVAGELPDVRFVIVGDGSAKRVLVDRAAREGLENVDFLPHQPAAQLRFSLASADVHLVSLAPGLAGFMEPSKVYGILAAARPLLAAVDPESEAARLVEGSRCGAVVAPGDASAWCTEIERLRNATPGELASLGAAGRSIVEGTHSREAATSDYARLIAGLAGDQLLPHPENAPDGLV